MHNPLADSHLIVAQDGLDFPIFAEEKKYPLSVPVGGMVVGFSYKLWICSWARSSAAVWA
jgi:hypothetical protein